MKMYHLAALLLRDQRAPTVEEQKRIVNGAEQWQHINFVPSRRKKEKLEDCLHCKHLLAKKCKCYKS
jgi:hypothetical protein